MHTRRVYLTTLTMIWAGLIFLLSSLPATRYSGAENALDFIPGLDYIVHGVLYFVLASFIYFTLRAFLPTRKSLLMADAVVLTLLYGVSDELHQSFVPGRTSSVLDLVADVAGAVCAVSLWAAVLWVRHKRYRRSFENPRPRPPRR